MLCLALAHSCITLPQLYRYKPSAILRELPLSYILNRCYENNYRGWNMLHSCHKVTIKLRLYVLNLHLSGFVKMWKNYQRGVDVVYVQRRLLQSHTHIIIQYDYFVAVSVVMALGNLGYSTVVLPGLFLERFGVVWTSVLGLALGTASNFGVAFGVKYSTWFASNYWAVLISTLLLGMSGVSFKDLWLHSSPFQMSIHGKFLSWA